MAGWLNKLFRRKNSGVHVWGTKTYSPLCESIREIPILMAQLEMARQNAMRTGEFIQQMEAIQAGTEFTDPPLRVEFRKLRKLQMGK
jgi:hypothetical protein